MYNQTAEKRRILFREMLRLRLSEETLTALYREQEMRTPTHFGTGQEAVAVGVCQALNSDDVVYSHHRCHNHYLAKGGSFFELAAELYGKEAGCSKGRGGSVHLTALDKGFIISSAILAQTIAVSTGSALAFKIDNNQRVAVSFFGDGSTEEGAFYESLNYAAINKLPILYICENNLYSTESTPRNRQVAGSSMIDRASAFKIPSEVIDGNNVFTIYEAVENILPKIREGHGPFFLECMTYRWREHVGPNFDYEVPGRTYRSEEEQRDWIENKCPVKYAESVLLERGIITHDEIVFWKKTIQDAIDLDVVKAKEAAWPQVSDLYENIY